MNATRMLAPKLARSVAPARRTLSVFDPLAAPVANMPNKISEYRKPFVANIELVGADNPTYLKGAEDKAQCVIAGVLVTFAMLQIGRGLYNMSNGVGKND